MNVAFVLHRPSSAENIGAVARVMKNFGLSRLAIVAPPSWAGPARSGGGGPARDDVLHRARTTARHASDVLETASVHAVLGDALAGATWSCATTSRSPNGRRPLSPRHMAREAVARALRGPVAIVFGEERRGLSDAELDRCQAVCTIPTAAEYDSMNLAQAAAVVAYELALALSEGGSEEPEARPTGVIGTAAEARVAKDAPPPDSAGAATDGPARHETLEALWAQVRAMLGAAGYLNPQNPERILAEWRRLLVRAEPTQREIELLIAAAKALNRRVTLADAAGLPGRRR